MNTKIEDLLNLVAKGLVLSLIIILPFFFLTLTTEFFETPKFIALVIITLGLILLWAGAAVATGKLKITKSPVDIPLLLLLIVAVVSTFFSKSPWVSIIGNLPKVHGSLSAIVVYVLLYFVLVTTLKHTSKLKEISNFMLITGLILSAWTLAAYFGTSLPLQGTVFPNFTPTGSSSSTVGLLLMFLPFVYIKLFEQDKYQIKIFPAIVASLFLTTIVLIGTTPLYIATALVLILIFLTESPANIVKNVQFVAPPLALALVFAVLSLVNIPYLTQNPIYSKAQSFPRELQAPFIESWKVSVSSFRDSPFWGSGPSTYPFDFTLYKPIEYNNSKVWNIRFDSAFNEYFQILATLGATGVLALILFTIVALSQAYKVLIHPPAGGSGQDKQLALSTFAFFIFLFLHPATLVTFAMGLLILTLLFVKTQKVGEYNLSVTNYPTSYAQAFDALPGVILMAAILLTMFVIFFVGKYSLADYYHRIALNSIASNQGLQAREALINAVRLNNYSDRYRIDLAQTSFALANAIAAAKSGGDGLSDQDKQNIQILLSESIDHGRAAVAISGQNPANWEVMAVLYRQIAGVAQNALVFSLDSYGRAIQRDPLNPILRLNVGGVYYTVKNYDLAVRFFTDSVNLKPDFANGYYNLAVALRDKGDLQTAKLAANRALELVKKDSPDYPIASKLVEELTSTPSAKEATTSAQVTAGKTDSALADDKKLPKVLDLPKPEKITTPSAIKASPSPTPQP